MSQKRHNKSFQAILAILTTLTIILAIPNPKIFSVMLINTLIKTLFSFQ